MQRKISLRERRRDELIKALRALVAMGKTTNSYRYLSWRYGVPETDIRILHSKVRGNGKAQ
jgi:hypothetical protein